MSFEFENTNVEGVLRIKPHIFEDGRGLYIKYYEKNAYQSHGIQKDFNESSEIISKRGTLRGLHYQFGTSQAKLVHVIKGRIFDVAVDLRKDSKTFGKCHVEMLDEFTQKAIYIPADFAHGFMALEDNTIFSYQSAGEYFPEQSGGILWKDSNLAIDWPIKNEEQIILSEKDRHAMTFEEYCNL